MAALAIVYDYNSKKVQRFFRGHTDDITCLTIFEPESRAKKNNVNNPRAASGQTGLNPFFCIWRIDTCEELYRLGAGVFERAVCGVGFSYDGKHVAAIGMDDNHQIGVWNLVGGKDKDTDEIVPNLLCKEDTQTGTPPMLTELVWCDFDIPNPENKRGSGNNSASINGTSRSVTKNVTSSNNNNNPATLQALITVGKGKHLKIWTFDPKVSERSEASEPFGRRAYSR